MVEIMKENIKMIKNMVLEYLNGAMGENILDNGIKENNMVEAYIYYPPENKKLANGIKVED